MAIDFKNPTPLYRQIVEDIKDKISSGQLMVGEQIGSHQELAKEYGVSLITVKKALADLIRDGILFSRVGKGTYVAQKSVSGDLFKQRLIGVVLNDLNNPFFSLIVQSVEVKASENGYSILLSTTSNHLEKEENQIHRFYQLGVNGLIIASRTHVFRASPTIRKLHRQNFPYVMVSYVEDKDIYHVGSDHELGGFLATEHLIKCGHKKIGYIDGEEGNLLSELRKRGYQKALQQYGKSYNENFVFRLLTKWQDYQSGYEIGRKFCELSEKPNAIFAYKDLVALGFEQAVLDRGLKVPDDVSIVGFDNIERSRYAPVPLTTIHQPTDKIGELAFETLIKRINGNSTETRIILKPELVIRKSCCKV